MLKRALKLNNMYIIFYTEFITGDDNVHFIFIFINNKTHIGNFLFVRALEVYQN